MTHLALWYLTDLPENLVDSVKQSLDDWQIGKQQSILYGDRQDLSIRDSTNSWVSTSLWLGGFLWYYIDRANRENFLYDITQIDENSLQHTRYGAGNYYNWHTDEAITSLQSPGPIVRAEDNHTRIYPKRDVYIRKLSFSLQLSDESEYEGGDLQFLGNNRDTFFAPKKRGTLVVFDSRTVHRVRKIKSGTRESLVGWVVGPRWR